ncbi:MAG: BrnT family toxin [Rhodocyclaceae bacterium]
MISYDDVKRVANLKKHGFDFVGAEVIFEGWTLTREDRRGIYGEQRLQTLGAWHGVVVVVVHTPRDEVDHIISIRKAERHEERIYWQYCTG